MDSRYLGAGLLAAAALVACSTSYSIPENAYPGGGNGAAGGGGNGAYGGGGGAGGGSTGAASTGGYSTGGSSGGTGTTTAGSGTGSSSGGSASGTSSGTSGGSSGGSTTGGGANQLIGALAFTVASAGQFLPVGSLDGGPSQMEFDMASFVLGCPGGSNTQAGSVLVMNLYSGALDQPLMSGTYQIRPGGAGLPYATATINQNDGLGTTTPIATGQSGQITWTSSFSGLASGTLSINMDSNSGPSYLSGNFLAPYCGSF